MQAETAIKAELFENALPDTNVAMGLAQKLLELLQQPFEDIKVELSCTLFNGQRVLCTDAPVMFAVAPILLQLPHMTTSHRQNDPCLSRVSLPAQPH